MAKKKDPAPVRVVIDNASDAPAPASNDADENRSSRRGPPPPLPSDCPVIPIGTGEGVHYYLNGLRQLVTLAVKEHTRLQILGLFGEDADLVHEIWPRKKLIAGKDGKREEIITGWRAEDAALQLIRLSATKGLWSPLEKARGRGCWASDDGTLIVNTGSAVLVGGRWQRPGLFGDCVFPAREGIMKPAPVAEPAGARGAANETLALLQSWNWRRPIDARLLLGWIVCAFWGAALPIRPVGWLIGPKATGKSTLQGAINALLGGWVMSVLDPTPASIWQTLKHDCLAVGIDEAEADEDKDNRRRLNELVRLARLCFSGGKMPRGSSDGEATEYGLRSAVLFSSINPPPLLPQDRSRIIMMRLAKLPAEQRLPDVSPRRLRTLGTRLLRRAIDAWPRFAAALEQYRIALKAAGHEGRSAELFGSALAAADVVLNDHPVDSDSAAELAAQLPFASLPEAEDDLPEEEVWLSYLLSRVIPLDTSSDGRQTVRDWLRQGARFWNIDVEWRQAERVLGYYGLKISRPSEGGAPTHFAIANRAHGLERLHEGTHWAARPGAIGGWKSAARDLEGAHETTQRFASGRGKGTAIPLKLAFPDGYDDDGARAPAADKLPLGNEP